jgi:hypothetical protein
MSDSAASRTSRVCPACGRIVPPTVERCRCGRKLVEDIGSSPSDLESGFGGMLGVILTMAAIYLAVYLFSPAKRTAPTLGAAPSTLEIETPTEPAAPSPVPNR